VAEPLNKEEASITAQKRFHDAEPDQKENHFRQQAEADNAGRYSV
jgi:hypothetical protein